MNKDEKKILLVENDKDIANAISNFLRLDYTVDMSYNVLDASKRLQNRAYQAVVTNTNLNSSDYSLLDGLSLARMAQNLSCPVSTILYTEDINPVLQAQISCTSVLKLLDLFKPTFQSELLQALRCAFSIIEWKSVFTKSKVNNSILDHISSIDDVSPIHWNGRDEILYNSFFDSYPYGQFCYANSWAYICQAARINGFKFFDGYTLITIAVEVNETGETKISIINPMGKSTIKKTLALAEKLTSISDTIIFKKVSDEQVDYFLNSGKCKVCEQPKSGRLIDYYDDIYPQVVVNLKAFLAQLNSHFKLRKDNKWIRSRLYTFRNNMKRIHNLNYTIETTRPELFEDFLHIVYRWKSSFIKRYRTRKKYREFDEIPTDDAYYIEPYFSLFDYFAKAIDNKNTISIIVYLEGVPVGFSLLSRVSNECMGLYANIGDTDYTGLAEFMLYQNLSKAYWSGYKYVNLGGTESRSLYNFYRKLKLDVPGTAAKDNPKSLVNRSFEIRTKYLTFQR